MADDLLAVTLPPLVSDWPEGAREEWSERAGIIQADTGCTREESERRAEGIVRRRVERESRVTFPALA